MAEDRDTSPETLPLTESGALKVELVPFPPGDNPWRTRQDYIDDRTMIGEMHKATLDSLRTLARTSRRQTIALIVSVLVTIATCVSAGVALLDYLQDLRSESLAAGASPVSKEIR